MSDSKSYLRFVLGELTQSFGSRQEIHLLADRLIRLAEHAYLLRDLKTLQDASLVLSNLPVGSARRIGWFYQALTLKRDGKIDEAQALLESVAETAPIEYKARSIQTLGTIRHERGHLNDALQLYLEAARTALNRRSPNLLANLMAQLQICFIKSDIGDHQGALTHLKSLLPLVMHTAKESPVYFYIYHNALAVEFSEGAHTLEAHRACSVALASPFASAYPEWSETRDEIAAKRKSASPSVVAIHRVPEADRTVEADQAAEADRATRAESQRKPEPSGHVAFIFPTSNKDFFQRSTITIPARTTIALNAVSIGDRVLICIGPRAPPALS